MAVAFAVGIIASLIADARDPDADAKRAERAERTSVGNDDDDAVAEPEPTSAARD